MMAGEFQFTQWSVGKGRYRVEHEGETIAENVTEPIVAAARWLVEIGVDPDDMIQTIIGESNMRSLRAKVSTAIALGSRGDV